MTRGRALAMLALGLVVLLGGTLAVTASAAPGSGPAAAQPAPNPPLPLPTGDPCTPDSPLALCHQPAPSTTPPTTGVPLPPPTTLPTLPSCDPSLPLPQCSPSGAPTSTTPCTGEGCIPQPPTSTLPPGGPGIGQPGAGGTGEQECGFTHIGGCITNAINDFFAGVVTAALNPLLDLLSATLLTTPTPSSLPRIGELWDNSWQILLVSYAMLVLIAGVLVMSYETLQTRHSVKEIAPRLVVGFLSGALSLWVATKGIEIANALVPAIMGSGVDAGSAADTLKNMILAQNNEGGFFLVIIGLVLAGMLLVLLVTYIVRVALTIILIAGAPLALMFHALPQTDGIAKWWWKAYGGCLAIQVGQSLTLIVAVKVFLAPGGFTIFGATGAGVINMLVAIALMYILFKIPFWILGSIRGGGGGRSLVGSLVRGFLAYKTFGLLGGGGGGRKPRPSGGNRGGGGGSTSPYANPTTTSGGQYVLPLTGLKRGKLPTPPHQRYPARGTKTSFGPRRAPSGVQLSLPLGDDWPENKPVLGRDGQYRLPLDVARVTPTPPPPLPGQPGPGGGRRGGQQLQFEFDPYRGNRPRSSGQYPLPLDVTRTPRPAGPPPATPPRPRPGGTQLELPFDPYKGTRPTRSGQYPMPLDGVRRVPPATPAPPAPPPRPAARGGRQLRLPLDLPKPPRRTAPPKPTSGGTP
ncbi:MAG: hypothetical protein JWQ81_935 [Amycolatopsis sp.]|nr:hypothetical protein [Amycolatopsis sp.]